jgi:hypothetical protein
VSEKAGRIYKRLLNQNFGHLPGFSLPLNDVAYLIIRELSIRIDFDVPARVVAVIAKLHLLRVLKFVTHDPPRIAELAVIPKSRESLF